MTPESVLSPHFLRAGGPPCRQVVAPDGAARPFRPFGGRPVGPHDPLSVGLDHDGRWRILLTADASFRLAVFHSLASRCRQIFDDPEDAIDTAVEVTARLYPPQRTLFE